MPARDFGDKIAYVYCGMCGISGWYAKGSGGLGEATLHALADALNHRGPDDRGYFFDHGRGVAFAHDRLSIIDLSPAGHQPMATEDGSVVLNYNGELYNFVALRRELESRGHAFTSHCDTEVVLRALAEWGERAVGRFRGMFAFAAWFPHEEKLLLARDPLGMKPLYYIEELTPQRFVFASELKAFLVLPGFTPRMDRESLQQFLEFGFIYDEHRTSLEGIRKLPPGHMMIVRRGVASEPLRYFHPPRPEVENAAGIGTLQEQLHAILTEVVEEHLVADVPIGLLLSGGLDSSLLAALASRRGPITTFTMGFADSELDERPYARRVSEHIGSRHHEILVEARDVMEQIDDAIRAVDDLFGDWGVVTTRLLYARAKDLGLKVVLVGEGSDEIFGGYPQFEVSLKHVPREIAIAQLFRRYSGRRHARGFATFRRVMRLLLEEAGGDLFHAIRLFETQHQLPNNYVMKVDKASMSVSVEARAPYLDQRVAEFACRLPRELLLRQRTNKWLLRSMAERFDLLPPDVARRPKLGGSIAASWIDHSPEFRIFAREVVLDTDSWTDAAGLRDAMVDYFDRGMQGYRFPHGLSIFSGVAWKLLMLNLWAERYGVQPEVASA